MPSPVQIRKQILKALEEKIFPMLQTQSVTHVLAESASSFKNVEHWTLNEDFLPEKTHAPPQQIIKAWHSQGVKCSRFACLNLVYSGVADFRIGIDSVTAQSLQLAGQKLPGGVTNLRMKAPCAIYIPPGVAYSDGYSPFIETSREGFGPSKTLCIVLTGEVMVYLAFSDHDGLYSTHLLQVTDSELQENIRLYVAELQENSHADDNRVQVLMLHLLHRIHHHLVHTPSPVRNSCWPPLDHALQTSHRVSRKSANIWARASEYIDIHLDCDIKWDVLAANLGVSAVHLNRVCQKMTGMTVMRYVTSRRVNAAKLLLSEGTEPVGEIATLVGFTNPNSFSMSFKRETGCSPREYRHSKGNPFPGKKYFFEERQETKR